MKSELKNLYLLTPADLKRMRRLVRTLDRALIELIELKRVTTFDDERPSCPPHESDLIEEASFIEHQLVFPFPEKNATSDRRPFSAARQLIAYRRALHCNHNLKNRQAPKSARIIRSDRTRRAPVFLRQWLATQDANCDFNSGDSVENNSSPNRRYESLWVRVKRSGELGGSGG